MESANPPVKISLAAERPPIEEGEFIISFLAPKFLIVFSKVSLARPGPQIIKGIFFFE